MPASRASTSRLEEFGEPDDTGVRQTRETILARYNTNTGLEAEVKPDEENTIDFLDLKSR